MVFQLLEAGLATISAHLAQAAQETTMNSPMERPRSLQAYPVASVPPSLGDLWRTASPWSSTSPEMCNKPMVRLLAYMPPGAQRQPSKPMSVSTIANADDAVFDRHIAAFYRMREAAKRLRNGRRIISFSSGGVNGQILRVKGGIV
jgi:hypothetical protein